MFYMDKQKMDKYISAEIVTQIVKDKNTELEAIVRCYNFPPKIRNVSPLYKMFTNNSTEYIISYDLYKMYIAMIFYLKVQLNPKEAENPDCRRAEYDLGYMQYHLIKKYNDKEIDVSKYEEEICHAYEKCILKLLFLIQYSTTTKNEQLKSIKNAVLTMNENTLCKLGYVHRLSNFKSKIISENIPENVLERYKYYTESETVNTPADIS